MKRTPLLTKSKSLVGVLYSQRLHGQVRQTEFAAGIDDRVQAIVDRANVARVEAQTAVSGSVFAEADYLYPRVTLAEDARRMANSRVPAVYAAAFEHDGVLARVDILD